MFDFEKLPLYFMFIYMIGLLMLISQAYINAVNVLLIRIGKLKPQERLSWGFFMDHLELFLGFDIHSKFRAAKTFPDLLSKSHSSRELESLALSFRSGIAMAVVSLIMIFGGLFIASGRYLITVVVTLIPSLFIIWANVRLWGRSNYRTQNR